MSRAALLWVRGTALFSALMVLGCTEPDGLMAPPGGQIVPGSVHASLGYGWDRFGGSAGGSTCSC